MSNSLIILIGVYGFATIIGIVAILYFLKENQLKKAVISMVAFFVCIQFGLGYSIIDRYKNGDYQLNKQITDMQFVNPEKDSNDDTEIDEITILDDTRLSVTVNDVVEEVLYKKTATDRISITHYKGMNYSGKIDEKLDGGLTLTLTCSKGATVLETD